MSRRMGVPARARGACHRARVRATRWLTWPGRRKIRTRRAGGLKKCGPVRGRRYRRVLRVVAMVGGRRDAFLAGRVAQTLVVRLDRGRAIGLPREATTPAPRLKVP